MESPENDQELPSPGHRGPPTTHGELPKRRRRKRDPVTGELLALPPLPHEASQSPAPSVASVTNVGSQASIDHRKLPRRKRHPKTGELMPLGLRYDPKSDTVVRKAAGMKSSMRRLSISQEQRPKRVKLASDSSADTSPLVQATLKSPKHGSPHQETKSIVIDLSETDESHDNNEQQHGTRQTQSPPSIPKSTSKTSMLRPTAPTASSGSADEPFTLASFLKASATLADESDTDESEVFVKKPGVRSTPTHGKTSILNPIAAKQSVRSEEEAADDDESDPDEGEWFVEAIVGHRMSDPRSHPGRPSVVLYQTKWEGHDEPTWEPADSFVDPSTVAEYRARVGLDKAKQTIRSPERIVPVVASSSKPLALPRSSDAQASQLRKSKSSSESSEDDGEEGQDGYEIEKILAHHMSDPRTHPGKPQTMLYKVKWVGYPATAATWEPKGSFPNLDFVNAYRSKVGLEPEKR
ncbi:hypothetical protein BST61_g8073 [Cercospora zeina]